MYVLCFLSLSPCSLSLPRQKRLIDGHDPGGVILLYYLPNNIMTAKRFTPEEKALLIARTQQNQTGIYNPVIKLSQVREALLDPQCWILFFFVLLNETVNGGIANFGKLIVKGLSGGDALLTTAYGIPQGALQVFFVFTGPCKLISPVHHD